MISSSSLVLLNCFLSFSILVHISTTYSQTWSIVRQQSVSFFSLFSWQVIWHSTNRSRCQTSVTPGSSTRHGGRLLHRVNTRGKTTFWNLHVSERGSSRECGSSPGQSRVALSPPILKHASKLSTLVLRTLHLSELAGRTIAEPVILTMKSDFSKGFC